jgi:hypothetical protein
MDFTPKSPKGDFEILHNPLIRCFLFEYDKQSEGRPGKSYTQRMLQILSPLGGFGGETLVEDALVESG